MPTCRAPHRRVRAAAGRRLREVLADHPEQEALVRAEAGKSRRHRPLRDLLPRAGETLTAIKPAWAMSPLVVASVLPPGRWFDVVIFDEASQIPPAQAISAISRAHQVVVAGDERQLPPTSFFTSAVDDEGARRDRGAHRGVRVGARRAGRLAADAPPLLALPLARRATHRLRQPADVRRHAWSPSPARAPSRWCASSRSRARAWSSPARRPSSPPRPRSTGSSSSCWSTRAPGPRSRSASSPSGSSTPTGIEEAAAPCPAPARTGVGDFFDEDRAERFFVKNLERVQGDERDAIILSIGYGKTPHGRVLHRFGPLNLEGGERRLNVAITRSRRRMTVVSSLQAADLDPARLKARGALMLRDFLAYAASQASALPAPPDGGEGVQPTLGTADRGQAPDPLRADFARRLRQAGLVVHESFGSAQPIDIAVEDPRRPGRVLLAVETDGPVLRRDAQHPRPRPAACRAARQARLGARAGLDDRPLP